MASHNENNIHPCGTRPFTNREFARIQTFSDSHVFGNTNIKKQSTFLLDPVCFGSGEEANVGVVVGNAVPPLLAQRIFESCLRTLKETDGVPVERDVVEID